MIQAPRSRNQDKKKLAFFPSSWRFIPGAWLLVLGSWLLILGGCTNDMKDQPKFESYEETTFFTDHRSARPLIDGVVARGHLNEDDAFYTGKVDGKLVKQNPIPVTREVLERGRDRFNIYCIVCHGPTGAGDGMIIRRGFKPVPPSFHTDKLRQVEDGHFFDVISNGFATMQDYAAQVEPADRWAIAAYIRALQLSQNAKISQLTEADREKITQKPGSAS